MSDAVDISQTIADSVTDLFDTMLSLEVSQLPPEAAVTPAGHRVIGSLSFAGDILGCISLQVTEELARIITAAMLGMEADEIESEEEVKDVIRETCNIVGGNLKTALENAAIPCAISTPSITTGDDFHIETLNMDRYEHLCFQHAEHFLVVELAIKAAELADEKVRQKLKAVDINKFGRLDIISSTGDTVIELFDVMASMPVDLADTEAPFPPDMVRLMGSLDFAGEVLGNLQIQVGASFARLMTAAILGMAEDDVGGEEDLKDVIGEITNIIGGNLKAAFNDSGLNCRISPPVITVGTNFSIEILNMDRYEQFAFQHRGHTILVEVCVKIDEKARSEAAAGQPAATAPRAAEPGQMPADPVADAPSDDADDRVPLREEETAGATVISRQNLDVILDIPLTLTVELGRTAMKIEELLSLGPGSTVTLKNLEGESLDILANDKLIARGEVVVEKEKYGIRITEIISRLERIKSLK